MCVVNMSEHVLMTKVPRKYAEVQLKPLYLNGLQSLVIHLVKVSVSLTAVDKLSDLQSVKQVYPAGQL